MKKKFKKEIIFKLINKQIHKNYSYKSLILFYFLFNFDFFFFKNQISSNNKIMFINVYYNFKKNFCFNFNLTTNNLKKNHQTLKLFFKLTKAFLRFEGDTKIEKK